MKTALVAAMGASVCGGLDTAQTQYKALGYHPQAKGLDGNLLPNGGFFCVSK